MTKIATLLMFILISASCGSREVRAYTLAIKNVGPQKIDNVTVIIDGRSYGFGAGSNAGIYPVNADLTKIKTVDYSLDGKMSRQTIVIDPATELEMANGFREFVVLFADGIPSARIIQTTHNGVDLDYFSRKEYPSEFRQDFIDYKLLITAAKNGDLPKTQELVNSKTPLTYVSAAFISPIEYSIINNRLDVFRYLLGVMGENLTDALVNSCLHLAGQDAKIEMFADVWGIASAEQKLKFATPDEINHITQSRGGSPENRTSIIGLVIDGSGVKVSDLIGDFGHTPIFFAANENNLSLLKLLIAKGVDVNAKLKSGDTVLTWANRMTSETRKLLVDSGAK